MAAPTTSAAPPPWPRYSLLSIVVPAFDEGRTIGQLLGRLGALKLAIPHEVVVVDDGSTDDTAAVVDRCLVRLQGQVAARMIRQANGGKGCAVRTGIEASAGDLVVVQDADLEYDPADLDVVLAPLLAGKSRAVYGSHILGPSRRGAAVFYLGGRLVTACTNILYGSDLTDEPTCYKMVDGALLRSLSLEAKGFELCPELTAKLLKRGETILEVPIRYAPRGVADGKKIRARDGVRAIYELLRWRL